MVSSDQCIQTPTQVSCALCGLVARRSVALLCSDHVPRSIVRGIQQSWECKVFEHCGMTEMGLGGGVDCGAHSGYHLSTHDGRTLAL